MNTDVIKKEAIAHYNRMIQWAEKQPKNNRPDDMHMLLEIKEDWYSDFCPYCIEFIDDNNLISCFKCPLNTKGDIAFGSCCNDLWYKMSNVKTWRTWIKYAEKIKQYIIDNG